MRVSAPLRLQQAASTAGASTRWQGAWKDCAYPFFCQSAVVAAASSWLPRRSLHSGRQRFPRFSIAPYASFPFVASISASGSSLSPLVSPVISPSPFPSSFASSPSVTWDAEQQQRLLAWMPLLSELAMRYQLQMYGNQLISLYEDLYIYNGSKEYNTLKQEFFASLDSLPPSPFPRPDTPPCCTLAMTLRIIIYVACLKKKTALARLVIADALQYYQVSPNSRAYNELLLANVAAGDVEGAVDVYLNVLPPDNALTHNTADKLLFLLFNLPSTAAAGGRKQVMPRGVFLRENLIARTLRHMRERGDRFSLATLMRLVTYFRRANLPRWVIAVFEVAAHTGVVQDPVKVCELAGKRQALLWRISAHRRSRRGGEDTAGGSLDGALQEAHEAFARATAVTHVPNTVVRAYRSALLSVGRREGEGGGEGAGEGVVARVACIDLFVEVVREEKRAEALRRAIAEGRRLYEYDEDNSEDTGKDDVDDNNNRDPASNAGTTGPASATAALLSSPAAVGGVEEDASIDALLRIFQMRSRLTKLLVRTNATYTHRYLRTLQLLMTAPTPSAPAMSHLMEPPLLTKERVDFGLFLCAKHGLWSQALDLFADVKSYCARKQLHAQRQGPPQMPRAISTSRPSPPSSPPSSSLSSFPSSAPFPSVLTSALLSSLPVPDAVSYSFLLESLGKSVNNGGLALQVLREIERTPQQQQQQQLHSIPVTIDALRYAIVASSNTWAAYNAHIVPGPTGTGLNSGADSALPEKQQEHKGEEEEVDVVVGATPSSKRRGLRGGKGGAATVSLKLLDSLEAKVREIHASEQRQIKALHREMEKAREAFQQQWMQYRAMALELARTSAGKMGVQGEGDAVDKVAAAVAVAEGGKAVEAEEGTLWAGGRSLGGDAQDTAVTRVVLPAQPPMTFVADRSRLDAFLRLRPAVHSVVHSTTLSAYLHCMKAQNAAGRPKEALIVHQRLVELLKDKVIVSGVEGTGEKAHTQRGQQQEQQAPSSFTSASSSFSSASLPRSSWDSDAEAVGGPHGTFTPATFVSFYIERIRAHSMAREMGKASVLWADLKTQLKAADLTTAAGGVPAFNPPYEAYVAYMAACVRHKRWNTVVSLFQEMLDLEKSNKDEGNTVSVSSSSSFFSNSNAHTLVMTAYDQLGRFAQAFSTLQDVRHRGMALTLSSVHAVLGMCVRSGNDREAMKLWKQMDDPAPVVSSQAGGPFTSPSPRSPSSSSSSLSLKPPSPTSPSVEVARSVRKDKVSYDLMISVLAKSGAVVGHQGHRAMEAAFAVYEEAVRHGFYSHWTRFKFMAPPSKLQAPALAPASSAYVSSSSPSPGSPSMVDVQVSVPDLMLELHGIPADVAKVAVIYALRQLKQLAQSPESSSLSLSSSSSASPPSSSVTAALLAGTVEKGFFLNTGQGDVLRGLILRELPAWTQPPVIPKKVKSNEGLVYIGPEYVRKYLSSSS